MDNYSKYLCIFGGGAVRGYAYLGVLKAFQEINFKPEKLAGSSVGSLFAAFCALDFPIDKMETIFKNVNYELFRDINLSFSSVFSISKGGVLLEWLREHIGKQYYQNEYQKGKNPPVCFKDLKRDLIIVATDLTNSVPFIFSKSTTPNYEVAQAIRASAAMPGLLTPVHYEDKMLCDGDLMKSNPIWRLDKTLCPDDLRILELRLEGGKDNTNIKNLIEYCNAVYTCITNYSTDFIMDIYSQKDKFNYIRIDTKDLLLVNFNINDDKKTQLIQVGYNATMEFFKKELPTKRNILANEYKNLQKKINDIEKSINKNDIKHTKNIIGDTFEFLSDIKMNIDTDIYKQIKKFRYLFMENLECSFLGREKLQNKNLLLNELFDLKRKLSDKERDLSSEF